MATKIAVAWLAYTADSECFRQSARAAMRTLRADERFKPTFVLLDDAWHPVDKTVREWFLSQPHTMRIITTYRRSGMLLGGENFSGQCRALDEVAKKCTLPDNGILLKTDCDALLLRADWLAQFAADGQSDIAGVFDFGNRCHFSVYGFCYALRARIIAPLAEDAEKYPAHHAAWEDHETSSRIYRLRGGEVDFATRFLEGPDSGLLCQPLAQVNDTFVHAQACTFAWDYQAQPPHERQRYRAEVAGWMRRLNDLAEGAANPAPQPGKHPSADPSKKDS